jgi:hypothetical protein
MIFMATLSLFLSIFNIWLTNKFTFDLYILYIIPRLIEFRTKLIANRKKLH